MNKQEVISKLKSAIPKNNIDDYQRGEAAGLNFALLLLAELDESEKPVVPQFVADFYESIKDDFENKVYELCLQYKHRGDELPQGVAWWFGDSRNKPIETLVMMHKLGYEVQKEKLYTVEIPNPNSAGGKMKRYQVVGFEDDGPVFCFTVTAKNFSEALREIGKDYYMTDMTFYKLEVTEVEE